MDEIELSDQYYRRVISGHEGTHLAESRRTSGAFAAGELDDETNQVTNSSEWVEAPQPEGDTSEAVNTSDSSIDTPIACAVTAVGTLAVTYVVTKYVRPWWLSRGRPRLGQTWKKVTRRNDDAAESSTSREIDEVIGAKVTSTDLRIAVEHVCGSLGEEEAQRELLDILVHAAAIAASLRRLSEAVIDHDAADGVLEWRETFEMLATNEVAACITSLLDRAETDDGTAPLLAQFIGVREKELSAVQQVDCQAVAEILRLPGT